MKRALISVIIPVYNVEKYLRECLDSIINQTLKDIEIICVNDGSTDSSLEILKEYSAKDNRIIILEQKNQGAGTARNKGLEIAKGEYLCFLDSDDIFIPNMLERAYDEAILNKSDVVCFQYNPLNVQTGEIGSPTGIFPLNPDNKNSLTFETDELQEKIFTISNPMPWNKIIKRELVMKNDIKYQSLTHSNDVYFTMCCMAFSKKITFLFESFILYRYNRANSLKNTRDDNPYCFYEAYCELFNKLKTAKLYNKFKKSFLNSLVSSTYWTYNNTNKRKMEVKNFALKTIFPRFSLDNNENLNLLNKSAQNTITRISFPQEVIVSLTSYPARINTVNQTIETLLKQSFKADRVILWLAQEQFPNKENDLPKQLLDLVPKGLTIDWCEDIKSYKKLIPALKKYPDAIIVTADDDLLYDKIWLESLIKAYVPNKKLLYCHRITRIMTQNGELDAFNRLEYYDKNKKYHKILCTPSVYNKLSGGAGTLYPPHCFSDEIFNKEVYTNLAPTSDDLWFYIQALLNGYRVKVIDNNIYKLKYIEGSQDVGLCRTNDANNLETFKTHLNNLYKYYKKDLNYIFKKEGFINMSILNFIKSLNHDSFSEIFSVKNRDIHKIITICGIKMKFKSKKLIQRKKEEQNQAQIKKLQGKINDFRKSIKVVEKGIKDCKKLINSQKRDFEYKLCKYMHPDMYPEYLKDWYKRVTGENLNLDNPQTFNEKIQWLKLYDSTPLKTRLADKYLVRDWVKEKIGEEYLIPLLGVWDNFDEIDFDSLPDKFVLKCNHGCGYNIIVPDKSKLNIEEARKKINNWMNENFAFHNGLELHYAGIPRKIIAEKYLENENHDLWDYKFWCFDGKVEYIQFLSERNTAGLKMAFYDKEWNKQDFVYSHPLDLKNIEKPNNLGEMIYLAERLSNGFNHARLDFYRLNNGQIYFGEMTFTSCSGICKWEPKELDLLMGQMIKLPIEEKELINV